MLNESGKWHRHLGAYGICTSEDKLLVIQKGRGPYTGRYDLPGGTVEANESLAEAVVREFMEETGVSVSIKRNIGVCELLIPYELPKRGTTHIHHVAVFYFVESISGVSTDKPQTFDGQDSLGAVWVKMNELHPANSSPLVVQAQEWLSTGRMSHECGRWDPMGRL